MPDAEKISCIITIITIVGINRIAINAAAANPVVSIGGNSHPIPKHTRMNAKMIYKIDIVASYIKRNKLSVVT